MRTKGNERNGYVNELEVQGSSSFETKTYNLKGGIPRFPCTCRAERIDSRYPSIKVSSKRQRTGYLNGKRRKGGG